MLTTYITVLLQIENLSPEIYQYCNEVIFSWYDFAKAIFELHDIAIELTPIESKAYPTVAQRPLYSVSNNTKIKDIFEI